MPNLVVMAQLHVEADKGDEMVEAVRPLLASLRTPEPEFPRYCYRSIDDPDLFAVFAAYPDTDAFAAEQQSGDFAAIIRIIRPYVRRVTWSRYRESESTQSPAQLPVVPGLVVIGQSRVRPGMAEVIKAGQARVLAGVRGTEPRCLSFSHYWSIDDPDLNAVREEYVDAEAFAAHQQSEHFKIAMTTHGPLLEETVWSRYRDLGG
jgi:quinol monooxygenase YgiN